MIKCALCVLFFIAVPVMAWQQDSDDLKARLLVEQQRAYLGEEVAVILELATPNWFTKAARIQLPSQLNVLWLQRQVFADNSRQRIGNANWTVQRWPLAIYPRRTGKLVLQPLRVSLAVADSAGNSVDYQLTLRAPELLGIERGALELVASNYQLSLEVEGVNVSDEVSLQAGDALQLAYISRAEQSLAMFLPEISPTIEPVDGITLYRAIPELIDSSERGQRVASRTDRFTLVAEHDLNLFVSAADIRWLDKESRQQKTLAVPTLGVPPRGIDSKAQAEQYATLVWLALLLLAVSLIVIERRASLHMTPLHRRRQRQQTLCLTALQQGDWATFAGHLYALYDSLPDTRGVPLRASMVELCSEDEALRLLQLLEAAYQGRDVFVDLNDGPLVEAFLKRLAKHGRLNRESHAAPFIL